MDNTEQQKSPFDARFLIVMALVVFFWIQWNSRLAEKYPDHFKAKSNISNPTEDGKAASEVKNSSQEQGTLAAQNTLSEVKSKSAESAVPNTAKPESFIKYEDDVWSFEISTKGMAVKDVLLKKYTDRDGKNFVIGEHKGLAVFSTALVGRREPLDFDIKRTSEFEFVGTALVDGMRFTKIYQIDSEKYILRTTLRAENVGPAFTGFVTELADVILPPPDSGFLSVLGSFDHQEFFALYDGTHDREILDVRNAISENYSNVKILSFGSRYFSLAIVDGSTTAPAASVLHQGNGELVVGKISHQMLGANTNFEAKFGAFAGPKSYELLKSIDADMSQIVNFGFFTSIAKGIFWLMKSIYASVGNWGVAIIILTLLVRILVLPFNLLGYRQMAAMQKINPQMKIIREKYKNDKNKMNMEIMNLMREAKANPLGGCLPMLIQLPVFFALYQVIGQSIELYKAPFVLWITDLSVKDPYYILPVLMGLTMFVQQKITPSTLDETQQKVMMYMPIIFSLFTLALPSALTLYIFISSVFAVVQQYYFMKDTNKNEAKNTIIDIVAEKRT